MVRKKGSISDPVKVGIDLVGIFLIMEVRRFYRKFMIKGL